MNTIRILNPIEKHQIIKFTILSHTYQYIPYSTKPTKPMPVKAKPLQLGEAKKAVTIMAQRLRWPKLWTEQLRRKKKTSWHILQKYEKVIGLKEVKEAQLKVRQQEAVMVETMQERQAVIEKLLDTQRRIKVVHSDLGKLVRGEDKYLVLMMQEHTLLKEEETLIAEQRQTETKEREAMASLSNIVRESQEKERAHAERTKYWSLLGLMIGLLTGILGT